MTDAWKEAACGVSPRVVESYVYLNEASEPIARVDRLEPGFDGAAKSFLPYLADGRGGFGGKAGLNGTALPFYHLDEVKTAIAGGQAVYCTEGEGKCDRLRAALRESGSKVAATTIAGGANAPLRAEHVAALGGVKTLYFLADSDVPGDGAATERSRRIAEAYPQCDVRVIDLFPDRDDGSDVSDWLAEGHTVDELQNLVDSSPNLGRLPVEGVSALLKDVERFIRRFVVLGDNEGKAVALWTMLSYAVEVTDCVPYLAITSAEKGCGKTRVLEVLEQIVARPWLTGRTTAAVLSRKIDKEHPTLLLDETDATFRGDKEYAETLRGILNTGYLRSGKTSVCVTRGQSIDYVDLSTFGLKALAGIGNLPDTVADRSIPIRLERKLTTETVERFRRKNIEKEASCLQARLQRWAEAFISIEHPEPMGLDDLPDRAADIWEALLMIAEAAGEAVAGAARKAAVALCGSSREDESRGIIALRDIRACFDDFGCDRMRSDTLAIFLAAKEESPWGRVFGRDFDARALASILKPFGIRPHTVRFDDNTTAKGYHRHYFEPVWARYIPSPMALPPETQQKQQASQRFKIRALSLPHAVTRRLVRDATDRRVTNVTLVTSNPEGTRNTALAEPCVPLSPTARALRDSMLQGPVGDFFSGDLYGHPLEDPTEASELFAVAK